MEQTLPKYTPQHVANFFLDLADEEGVSLTQLKLMKLVYIAYGWYLAITGEKLFDEPIQAWRNGPVIPSLYHEFKSYGRLPIDGRATSFDLDTGTISVPRIPETDVVTVKILTLVWESYKRFSAAALVRRTHDDGTPWAETYVEGARNIVIPPEVIEKHYKARLHEYIRAAQAA